MAAALSSLGRWDEARQWIERAKQRDPDNLFMRYNLGFGLTALFHDADAAMEMLDPVLARGGPSTIRLAAADPNLDSLRGDERFQRSLQLAAERLGIDLGVARSRAAAATPLRS